MPITPAVKRRTFLTQDKLGYLICSSVSIDGKILGDVISAVHFCIIEDIL